MLNPINYLKKELIANNFTVMKIVPKYIHIVLKQIYFLDQLCKRLFSNTRNLSRIRTAFNVIHS